VNNDIRVLYTSWVIKYTNIGMYSHEEESINTYFMEQDTFAGHIKPTGGPHTVPVLLVGQPFCKVCDMCQTMNWTLFISKEVHYIIHMKRKFSHCRLYIHGPVLAFSLQRHGKNKTKQKNICTFTKSGTLIIF
jgi:hypothetical protein